MYVSSQPKKKAASNTQLAKLQVKFPKYNGQKGRARRWWKKARRILSTLDPSADKKAFSTNLPVIDDSLRGYASGQTLLNQLSSEPANLLPGGYIDLDKVMEKFILHHDQHSLDLLFQEWIFFKQADKETIGEFVVRFRELVEDLTLQGYSVPDNNAWVAFRNKVRRASKLREMKEVNDIPAAVTFLAACESSAT